jgi:hypothetical protein
MKKEVHALFYAVVTAWSMSLMLPVFAQAGEQLTTLRVVGAPEGRFVKQASLTVVTEVKAVVRNVGDFEAKDIHVRATLPDGQIIDLLGPDKLEPNKKAIYENSGAEEVKSKRSIRVEASCSNCR